MIIPHNLLHNKLCARLRMWAFWLKLPAEPEIGLFFNCKLLRITAIMGDEMSKIFRVLLIVLGSSIAPFVSQAADLEVPIIEHADGELDTCILGRVLRLNPNGDGFLAVRSGPDSKYKKLDELHNNDDIWVFDQKGDWWGILYNIDNPGCSAIKADRP